MKHLLILALLCAAGCVSNKVEIPLPDGRMVKWDYSRAGNQAITFRVIDPNGYTVEFIQGSQTTVTLQLPAGMAVVK